MNTQLAQVAIIENHPLVREALRAVINGEPDFQVAEASGADNENITLEISPRHDVLILSGKPDLILFDLESADADDLLALQAVHKALPGVAILALIDSHQADQEQLVLEYGAEAVVAKNSTRAGLVDALYRWRRQVNKIDVFAHGTGNERV
jgi:DNA-binding NarL/FixJ family response regulator